MKRVGILTSGGDCQGLNAAIRGVAKALYVECKDGVEIYGITDGYRGLIEGDYRLMKKEDFSGILTLGGTILGTSRQPFKLMRVVDENSGDKIQRMKDNYPPGTRLVLLQMGDDPRPVEPNTRGTVMTVDDMGTLHCNFDNGRQLGLVPGEDSFRRLTEQLPERRVTVHNATKHFDFDVLLDLTENELEVVLAGGQLRFLKKRLDEAEGARP